MPTSTQSNDISGVKLTERQRQVWEMTHGLGEFEANGPMKAQQIADNLGISANAVYVTRRRVRQILDEHGIGGGGTRPKRIVHQRNHLDNAIEELRAEVEGYDDEIERLKNRLDEIERRRPSVEQTLENLLALKNPVEAEDDELVAA